MVTRALPGHVVVEAFGEAKVNDFQEIAGDRTFCPWHLS